MAQQVPVVDRAQTEELEQTVTVGVDRRIQFRCVCLDECKHFVGNNALLVGNLDRFGEPRDVLVTDFFVDDCGQQTCSELGVVGLFDNEARSRTDRQVVEFSCAGAVSEGRDGAGSDAHRIDTEQPFRGSSNGVDNLVQIDRFQVTVALHDPHATAGDHWRLRWRRFRGVSQRRELLGTRFVGGRFTLCVPNILFNQRHRLLHLSSSRRVSRVVRVFFRLFGGWPLPPDVVASCSDFPRLTPHVVSSHVGGLVNTTVKLRRCQR